MHRVLLPLTLASTGLCAIVGYVAIQAIRNRSYARRQLPLDLMW